MRFAGVFRWPRRGFPEGLETGNSILDDFLRRLDRECLGSGAVRKVYLSEIRDHLLEALEHAQEDADSPDAAAAEVVSSFGTPEELGREQRRECRRRFVREGVSTGIVFAVLMTFFDTLSGDFVDAGVFPVIAFFAYYALFFGIAMGWFLTFNTARPTPTGEAAADGTGCSFEVGLPRSGRISGALSLAVMLLIVGFAGAGIAGVGVMAEAGTAASNAFLVVIGTLGILFHLKNLVRITVYEDALEYRGPLGSREIPFAAITELRRPEDTRFSLISRYWRIYRLRWREHGRLKSIRIVMTREKYNEDRLLARLEEVSGSVDGSAAAR